MSIDWKRRAELLWQLLDDISTVDDYTKENDKLYRRLASQLAEQRSALANSPDGQTLLWEDNPRTIKTPLGNGIIQE